MDWIALIRTHGWWVACAACLGVTVVAVRGCSDAVAQSYTAHQQLSALEAAYAHPAITHHATTAEQKKFVCDGVLSITRSPDGTTCEVCTGQGLLEATSYVASGDESTPVLPPPAIMPGMSVIPRDRYMLGIGFGSTIPRWSPRVAGIALYEGWQPLSLGVTVVGVPLEVLGVVGVHFK